MAFWFRLLVLPLNCVLLLEILCHWFALGGGVVTFDAFDRRTELGNIGNESRRLLEQRQPLFRGQGTHYVFIWVGSPPQRVSVIVDTGSHHTAFPCVGCKCGQHVSFFNLLWSPLPLISLFRCLDGSTL